MMICVYLRRAPGKLEGCSAELGAERYCELWPSLGGAAMMKELDRYQGSKMIRRAPYESSTNHANTKE